MDSKIIKRFDLEICDSTNEVAKSMIKTMTTPFCVTSKAQTKGKGTMGKSFYSPKGKGLYMSVVSFNQIDPESIHQITLTVATIINDIINQTYHLDAVVVLPNDIYIKNKKLCGILTETSLSLQQDRYDATIIGIGMNLFQDENLPEDLKDIYTSLDQHTNHSIDFDQLIDQILLSLSPII